jgi:D-3-phosphoglycerate dehydrogenase
LDEGLIAGAALDVLPQEPPAPGDPLVLHPKTIVTPHAAFNSVESLLELQTIAARQMADVISGRMPDNIVNREVLRQGNLRASIKVKP